jgi:hypothetical protein
MYDVATGVKVVEVVMYMFVPSDGAGPGSTPTRSSWLVT